jgi:putative hydroxymethylpyrimidine transport system substrate-binding protein
VKINPWLVACLAMPVAVTTACGGGKSASGDPNVAEVKMVPDWIAPDITWLPYAVGIDKGFYKSEGIHTTIVRPPDNATTVKMVATGRGDIGESATSDVVFAKQQGLPVTSVANYTQSNNWGLFGSSGKPFTVADLRGKRIGVFDDAWTKAMLPVMLRSAGLKMTDIKQVTAVDDDIPLLLANKIDYASNTSNFAMPQYQQKTGHEPTTLLAKDHGAPDTPVWAYVANQRWLQKNPAIAKKWLVATRKATEWAIADPEDAVKTYQAHFQLKTADYQNDLAEWKATIPFLKGKAGFFTATDQQWTGLAQALKDAGQLDKVLAPTEYYTNSYTTP